MSDETFKQKVYDLISQVPEGRLVTYRQVAALCGKPRGAWEVGQVAHFGPSDLPWHRMVNKQGGLAVGWPGGGQDAHKALLEAEGVVVDNYTVDVDRLQWWPEQ